LTVKQREEFFAKLIEIHFWSTVKLDRNGLQFFWEHVFNRDWEWINMIKVPKVQSLPDILTVTEVEQLIGATQKLRYRVFLLTTYSIHGPASRRNPVIAGRGYEVLPMFPCSITKLFSGMIDWSISMS